MRTTKVDAPMQPDLARHILTLRDQRVMLDADLAALYGVETKVLVQAVKRNMERPPADFMFRLETEEFAALRSQFVTSKLGRGGGRHAPCAFTEQGMAMLSSVLNSPRAIAADIQIMRVFVELRAMAASHKDLAMRLSELESRTEALTMQHQSFSRNTRVQLKQMFDAIRALMTPPDPPQRPIGFVTHGDNNTMDPARRRTRTRAPGIRITSIDLRTNQTTTDFNAAALRWKHACQAIFRNSEMAPQHPHGHRAQVGPRPQIPTFE